jgi:hypothetical protein
MAAGAFQTYESFVEYQEKDIIALGTDSFKAAMFTSASNAGTLTNSILSALTNEVAAANGYSTGGIALTGVTATRSGRVLTFDCDNITQAASGGSIVVRRLVIYKLGTVSGIVNPLVATCLLDSTPADVTINDGTTLTIQIHASGILTIGGGS